MALPGDVRENLQRIGDPMALLEGIFAYAPVGLQVYDASGRCLVVNQAFRDLFGGEPPPQYNVLKDEIAARNDVLDLVRRAFAGETVHIPPIWYDTRELRDVRLEDANRVAVAATFFPILDREGRVAHVAIAFRDVTAEIVAREQAEAERDLFRNIFQQSGDGITVCDQEGMIRGLNPEAQRQYGVPKKAVPPAEWVAAYGLCTLEGEPLPLESVPLYRALRGERIENARWMVRRPDGSRRILTGTARPVRHEDGSPAGAVLTSRDESERLRLEEQLRKESERTERLYAQAQELNRVKDEFLATVSHELRTPLQAILGWARLLGEPEILGDPERRRQGLEAIERNARLQARLVEDILDTSRIVSGKSQPQWTSIDFASVVRTAVSSFQLAAAGKGLSLRADIAPHPVVITGDGETLGKVAWNLLSNAVKFTPKGGTIEVTLSEHGGQVALRVTDTGIGIAPAFLPHVFDRFRQADSSTTRAHGGLGVGLAMVRHFVEMHGGRVEAESGGPGLGATFVVRLPRGSTAEAVVPSVPEVVPAPGLGLLAGLRVLVVDDEVDTRDVLATMLGGKGAAVETAGSAAEALQAIQRRLPNVLVCDIGMPGEDGYQLLSRIRALPSEGARRLPAVALTAYAREEDRRRALASGYQEHVAKPVDPDRLGAAITEVVRRGVGPGAS